MQWTTNKQLAAFNQQLSTSEKEFPHTKTFFTTSTVHTKHVSLIPETSSIRIQYNRSSFINLTGTSSFRSTTTHLIFQPISLSVWVSIHLWPPNFRPLCSPRFEYLQNTSDMFTPLTKHFLSPRFSLMITIQTFFYLFKSNTSSVPSTNHFWHAHTHTHIIYISY